MLLLNIFTLLLCIVKSSCDEIGSDLCENDWVDATYFGLGITKMRKCIISLYLSKGCIFNNHTVGTMTQIEAYKFCYLLDNRARLLEIHNEEEMIYIKALTGI